MFIWVGKIHFPLNCITVSPLGKDVHRQARQDHHVTNLNMVLIICRRTESSPHAYDKLQHCDGFVMALEFQINLKLLYKFFFQDSTGQEDTFDRTKFVMKVF